ncbi:hypothetical protein EJ07DRAFT_180047 [Lizonia empirigonia]|nr:hypothetical protein EJ07DRAFT_180047 [Lizonia empirigonia]
MGIPVGWNIMRNEARQKDVLRADMSGTRSPMRRRARGGRPARSAPGAFDTDALLHASTVRYNGAVEQATAAARLSHTRTQLPALTPGFAPAGPRLHEADEDEMAGLLDVLRRRNEAYSQQRIDARRPRLPSLVRALESPQDDAPDAASTAVAPLPLSALRRSWSPVPTLDGLGDRDRSNSVSSTASHRPWQTFLATVVPDPVAPTAESSFASAAASASFTASSTRASSSNSNPNSAASERTHLTIPARACESDDDVDDADDTASDTDDGAHPLARRRMRPNHFADAPPTPPRTMTASDREARRFVRSAARSLLWPFHDPDEHDTEYDSDSNPHDSNPHDSTHDSNHHSTSHSTSHSTFPPPLPDQELRDARNLLQRLTSRRDITDDFWASVGLTRSFADGVERLDRTRF